MDRDGRVGEGAFEASVSDEGVPGEGASGEDLPGEDESGDRERAAGKNEAGEDAVGDGDDVVGDEPMPAFMRYGIFTVFVYATAVGALVGLPSVDVHGPSLIAFTVGFTVFMSIYFGSMWAGWLFVR